MISIIVTIALVGLIVFLITRFIPMPAAFQTAIYAVAGIFLLLYLLGVLGLYRLPPALR